jgi:hypothetical protein
MLFIIILLTFVIIVLLIFAKDSFINREFIIYDVIMKNPYLIREQIGSNYKTFESIIQ